MCTQKTLGFWSLLYGWITRMSSIFFLILEAPVTSSLCYVWCLLNMCKSWQSKYSIRSFAIFLGCATSRSICSRIEQSEACMNLYQNQCQHQFNQPVTLLHKINQETSLYFSWYHQPDKQLCFDFFFHIITDDLRLSESTICSISLNLRRKWGYMVKLFISNLFILNYGEPNKYTEVHGCWWPDGGNLNRDSSVRFVTARANFF